MRRVSFLAAFVAVGLLGLVLVSRSPVGTAAQDATPVTDASMTEHPFVGTWILDTDATTAGDPTGVITVSTDGTYHEVDPDGTTGLGTWRPTGERTAVLSILNPSEEGTVLIRVAVEVAADGQRFTAAYTFELFGPNDTRTGEYGPGEAAGVRLEAEAPGTPVGTLEELFERLQGTPAS